MPEEATAEKLGQGKTIATSMFWKKTIECRAQTRNQQVNRFGT